MFMVNVVPVCQLYALEYDFDLGGLEGGGLIVRCL